MSTERGPRHKYVVTKCSKYVAITYSTFYDVIATKTEYISIVDCRSNYDITSLSTDNCRTNLAVAGRGYYQIFRNIEERCSCENQIPETKGSSIGPCA